MQNLHVLHILTPYETLDDDYLSANVNSVEFHGRKRVQRTQASASGGDGPGRKTRIGGAVPDGDS